MLDGYIADTDVIINGYVLGKADLTNADVIAALQVHATRITLYELYRRRYADSDDANPWSRGYRQTIEYLDAVSEGSKLLTATPQITSRVNINTTGERRFGGNTLDNFFGGNTLDRT